MEKADESPGLEVAVAAFISTTAILAAASYFRYSQASMTQARSIPPSRQPSKMERKVRTWKTPKSMWSRQSRCIAASRPRPISPWSTG
jgi:hypothetical protein